MLMGVSSFTMLPIALELAAEVVWEVANPASTSAVLYFLGNGPFERRFTRPCCLTFSIDRVQRGDRRWDECASGERGGDSSKKHAQGSYLWVGVKGDSSSHGCAGFSLPRSIRIRDRIYRVWSARDSGAKAGGHRPSFLAVTADFKSLPP